MAKKDDITPRKMQQAVIAGFKRLNNFRCARLMFLKAYAGQYYDRSRGKVGEEPLNMIFNAIRVLVPNLVMAHPKHDVTTDFTAYRPYAEMLQMALDAQGKDSDIRDTYRRWLVDALFAIGIVKTGLCSSGSAIHFDEDDDIDPGSVYTSVVDFDNFVVDPAARRFEEAAFLGDSIRVPRQQLLDSGKYNNDLVLRLNKGDHGRRDSADKLSRNNITEDEGDGFHDYVEVVELWVPRAGAVVTVPREDLVLEDYLRVEEYYGPDRPTGQYTMLALTQPMPNNPMPVAPVGIWYDMHHEGNEMCKKLLSQARRQKNVVVYKRSAADDAQEVVDAEDGEAIGIDGEPSDVQTLSFGGQERSNEGFMVQIEGWFNRLSGNTESLGGQRSDANTATQAQILSQNSSVGIEDMRDAVYTAAGHEAEVRMWFLHTDPLIEIPLIKRVTIPAEIGQFGGVPRLLSPGRIEEQQVILTPEARQGDFLDYHLAIQMYSMSRMDPQTRYQKTMEFMVKVVPSVMQASLAAMQMGVPMSSQKLLVRAAKDLGIDWFDEVFSDPDYQRMMMAMLAMTPSPQGSQGTTGSAGGKSPLEALLQNGQPGQVGRVRSPSQEQNRSFQMPSQPSQAGMANNQTY